jgi:toxin-antitoxin system PIN domain toxin
MILPDVNLLLYAFRAEFPEHAATRLWLEGVLASRERVALHPLIGCAFLRLTTRALGVLPPAPMSAAIAFLSGLARAGGCESPAEKAAQTAILGRICGEHRIAGDGVTDAWLAAYAITHQFTLASHDRGFARFTPELDWLDPLPRVR